MRRLPLSRSLGRISAFACLLLLGACAIFGAATPVGQTYFVFFTANSAQLDQPALNVIAAAAAAATRQPDMEVRVGGFTDPVGSAQANLDLSKLRAQVVADQLVKDGLPVSRIARVSRPAPSGNASSIGPDSAAEQEARRVDITIGKMTRPGML